MRSQVDLLFADVAFSPSAQVVRDAISTVTHLGDWFVDVTTVWEFFVGVADGFDVEAPLLQVLVVALISKECLVTQSVDGGRCGDLAVSQGSFGFNEIGTVFSFAGGAPFAPAAMVGDIVVIKTSIAFVAEIGFA